MNPSSPYSIESVTKAAWKLARIISRCDAAELVRYRRLFTARAASQHQNVWDRYELLINRRKQYRFLLNTRLDLLGEYGCDRHVNQILATLPEWGRSAREVLIQDLSAKNPSRVAGSDGSRAIMPHEVQHTSIYSVRNI